MARKKPRRVGSNETRPDRPAAAPRILKPAAIPGTNLIILEPPASSPLAVAAPAAGSEALWTFYDAGVSSMRTALDLQAAFIQQMFLLSPASLAARCISLSHVRPN
jgi:hypothetical protein